MAVINPETTSTITVIEKNAVTTKDDQDVISIFLARAEQANSPEEVFLLFADIEKIATIEHIEKMYDIMIQMLSDNNVHAFVHYQNLAKLGYFEISKQIFKDILSNPKLGTIIKLLSQFKQITHFWKNEEVPVFIFTNSNLFVRMIALGIMQIVVDSWQEGDSKTKTISVSSNTSEALEDAIRKNPQAFENFDIETIVRLVLFSMSEEAQDIFQTKE